MSERTDAVMDESALPEYQPDRRAMKRFVASRRVFVRLLARPSFQAYTAAVRDISIIGIGLIMARSFKPGTDLAIELRSRYVGFSGILTARVCHATRRPDGSYLIGCSLSRSLTQDELQGVI